jgi:hypothetical protein
MDFVHDQLATGRKLRVLTILDIFLRLESGPKKDGQMKRARFTE